MTRRSLLLSPLPAVSSPSARGGGGGAPNRPSVSRQGQRLSPLFSRLESALNARSVQLQQEAPGIDPEYVVILETYGSVAEFYKAASKIRGLEWLFEFEVGGLVPDEDFYSSGSDPQSHLTGQAMLLFSDRRAIDELLSLWRRYASNENMQFERGWTKFRDLFRLLKDIRYWGVQDRLKNTGVYEYWQDRLEYDPESPIRFETELWFRKDELKRQQAVSRISQLVSDLGGQLIKSSCYVDIEYHGLLIELPSVQVQRVVEHEDVSLVRCDDVMLFKPIGQMSVSPLWNEDTDDASSETVHFSDVVGENSIISDIPRIALLDGLPLARHADISEWLIVDDPDGYEDGYEARYRLHGTAMASLIVNGDLNGSQEKLSRKIYARPVMKPDLSSFEPSERMPNDELPMDIIHRAIKRMFDGIEGEEPVAPTIKIVNLSIGDPNLHFVGKMSPFARLLDWLSCKYDVLFIVSAGNHNANATLSISGQEFRQLGNNQQEAVVFKAIQDNTWARKLLSPAESVNAVTIGALHEDESVPLLPAGVHNLFSEGMPAPYSAHGSGYLRSVKPDLALAGGRMLHREPIAGSGLTAISNIAAPGQRVAWPGSDGTHNRAFIRGTSNAAALATRGCGQLCDVLEGLFLQDNKLDDFETYGTLLIKSLITHGASWRGLNELMGRHLEELDANTYKKVVARNVGFGKPDLERALYCLDTRATILCYGKLEADSAHVYKVPIPDELAGVNVWRRLTVTLSWFTKPCPSNMKYRDSALWFTVDGDNKDFTSHRRNSVHWQQARRGTLQHEVFEGDELTVISESRMLDVKVNCKANASTLAEPVKYALAITLEVAEDSGVNLYQHIEQVISESVRGEADIRPRTQVSTR